MLNRTTPRRLTFIVLALILGILLGLAFFPTSELSGAMQTGFCDAVSEIPTMECQALESLYASTNGAGWIVQTGWLDTLTPCSWYGITCQDGHVWQLKLDGNGLSGPLPPDIGNLGQMQILLLNNNALSGPIPAELGKLTELVRLNLATNQLSGSVPSQLGDLDQLQNISLAYNDLSGNIPVQLAQMSKLQAVEFVSNTLEGPIPTELGSLAQLQWLDLTDNMLTGTIPTELSEPSNLTALYLSGNQLEGKVPEALCRNISLSKLGYNKLDPFDVDACLRDVITDEWEKTQTLPPEDVVVDIADDGAIELTWTPISAIVDGGYYEILYAQTSGGPYTVHGQTADIGSNRYSISDLDVNDELFFVVRTITPAHDFNQSDLVSINSVEAPTVPTAVSLSSFSGSQPFPFFAIPLVTALLLLITSALFLLLKRN
jgi:hypothetical protein